MTPDELIATRKHAFIEARREQLRINLLALSGGRPYIDARLSRFPKELSVDWDGGDGVQLSEKRFGKAGGNQFPGRRNRTFLVNHCLRAVKKLNQFVFSAAPTRVGVDEAWSTDCTRTGLSIDQFMAEVSKVKAAGRWCWIGVDRPAWDATAGAQSVADKVARGDTVYWQVYAPQEVVDWRYDAQGLAWALVETTDVNGSGPFEPATTVKMRVLYTRDEVRKYWLDPDDAGKVSRTEIITWTAGRVPLVCVGEPSSAPYFFDDAEAQMRAIMDLQSAYHHALFLQMFSLLVLPPQDSDSSGKSIGVLAGVEETADTKGTTRYVTPDGGQLATIRAEVNEVVKDFYRWWGQALQTETRQVASAESKAWDHMDTSNAIAELAGDLEEAEKEAVAISMLVDPSFKAYEPKYSRDFEIPDFAADSDALVKLSNIAVTESAKRLIERAAYAMAQAVSGIEPDEEDLQAFEEELKNLGGQLDFEAIAKQVYAAAGGTGANAGAGQAAGGQAPGSQAGLPPGEGMQNEAQGRAGEGAQGRNAQR